jgi:hypothetical protein
MKASIYDILKAKYLVNEDALKHWVFIIYLLLLAMLMIANSHRYEQKSFLIAELNKEVKELRSKFVDTRSELMKLRMESTLSRQMEPKGIMPSTTPPVKIKVLKENKHQ